MRASALRRGTIILLLFAIPTTLVSVSRGFQGDWQPLFSLQLVLLVVLFFNAALRNQLSPAVLGRVLITVCVIVALAGIYTFGAMAAAGHWFMAIAIFLIGMLYRLRTVLVSTVSLLAAMLIIAWLHLQGTISPAITPAEFAVAQSSWLVELMCAAVFIAIVLPTLRNFVEANQRWMSDYEQRREKIAHLAMHDELTGLPILHSVKDRLSMACNRSQRTGELLAVLFIDLDGFKELNDSYGHAAGDACLQAVAARLNDRLRQQDTASRSGGDEFVVILENVSGESTAAGVAQELIELIGQPIEFEQHQLQIGASIGVALCPGSGENAQSLLRNADIAMYRSKRAGRNGFVFAEVDTSHEGVQQSGSSEGDTAAKFPPVEQSSMLTHLRETVVNRCILVLTAMISVTVIANFWRITHNEIAPNLGFILTALAVCWALFLGRRYISLRVKTALTSSIGLLIALPGLFLVGLPGPAVGWGLAASLFLVGIFYERRICKILVIGVPLAIIMAGIGFVFDFFTLRVDVNEQAIHPSRWLVFILSAMAYSGMVLAAWWQYGKTTAHLINESTAQMAELVKLANVDALTGLPLLRLAADRLEMACIRAKRANSRAALFAIDLDGFKDINDTFGHEAGNHCLCEVARRLSACLRNTDTTARIGGDEFLVILDGVYEFEQVSTAAKQLIKEIALPMDFGGDQFSVSASIGIAIFPDHGTETDQLRQRADAAMYIAKRAGKNNFQFAALDWPVISSIKS